MKAKFTWKLKFHHERQYKLAYWKLGTVVYGRVKGVYFSEIMYKKWILFHPYLIMYKGKTKPPHSFTYYVVVGNIRYLLYIIGTIIIVPLVALYHLIFGCFATPDREYVHWWVSSFIWLGLGLFGLYSLFFG